jgi:hypothetical protein
MSRIRKLLSRWRYVARWFYQPAHRTPPTGPYIPPAVDPWRIREAFDSLVDTALIPAIA